MCDWAVWRFVRLSHRSMPKRLNHRHINAARAITIAHLAIWFAWSLFATDWRGVVWLGFFILHAMLHIGVGCVDQIRECHGIDRTLWIDFYVAHQLAAALQHALGVG